MKPKFLWLALIASLALNVAFIGGVVYSKTAHDRFDRDPAKRVAALAEELKLDDAQRQGLMELREKVAERWGDRHEGRDERRDAMLAALAAPDFDRAQVIALQAERSAERGEAIADTMQDLHGYLATLSPEQRAGFLEMAGDRGFFWKLFGRPRPKRE